jgi:hypothetical protein
MATVTMKKEECLVHEKYLPNLSIHVASMYTWRRRLLKSDKVYEFYFQ